MSSSFPVISLVFDTSCGEKRWHCLYQVCAKHQSDRAWIRRSKCKACSGTHILTKRVISAYINKQTKSGYSRPKFSVRHIGPKMVNLPGTQSETVYCNVFFQGFTKPELTPLKKLRSQLIHTPNDIENLFE